MRAVESRSIDELQPYAKNARIHSDAQIAQIAASIRAFGFTSPILIDDDNGVIAGHGRLQAAKRMGMSSVPCIKLDGLSAAQRRAYIITDNKLAQNATWDDLLLSDELRELLTDDANDLDALGFSAREIDKLLGTETPDVTQQLGAYQYAIIVDCTNEQDQAALLTSLEKEGRTCRLLTT